MSLTLALVIPMLYAEESKLLSNLLTSLRNQTVFPDEVILAVSEISREQMVSFKSNVRNVMSNELNITFLFSGKKMFSGANKTRGVVASSSDIISFMDPENFMQNQRIEYIKTIFENTKANVALHSYTSNKTIENTKHSKEELMKQLKDKDIFINPNEVYSLFCRNEKEYNKVENPFVEPFPEKNWHIKNSSFRKEVFRYNVFDHTSLRGASCCFIRDILFDLKNKKSSVYVIDKELCTDNKKPKVISKGAARHPGPWLEKIKKKNIKSKDKPKMRNDCKKIKR